MLEQIFEKIKNDSANSDEFLDFFKQRDIPSKTVLLNEGEVSRYLHFIKSGCLRIWFNKDGKDITFQFFFEGQAVSSIDSLISSQPSLFSIESIEPSTIISISKENFERLQTAYPDLKSRFQDVLYSRFRNYAGLFLSRIKDTPQERYWDLVENRPDIIRRVPQHYIASYLGITPISLSRIRNRK